MKIPMTSARLVAWTVLASPGIVLLAMPPAEANWGSIPCKSRFIVQAKSRSDFRNGTLPISVKNPGRGAKR
jgi:hypothetical protein